jgi:signal-transduction protein with cAMP-binding, CBS, and nucleotidyltransferase domain
MTSAPTLPDLEPYRRRVSAVMRQPVNDIAESATLTEIARQMSDSGQGGLLVHDRFGQHTGILTERDVTRALGRDGAAALQLTAADLMSRNIVAIHEGAFLFRAIGRMRRLNLRYMPVTDNAGRFIGMLTARALLRLRAQDSQMIADGLDIAETADELGQGRAALPGLASTLLAEGSDAPAVAAVISGIYADITARAAAIVEAEFEKAGDPAPAPWCMLILGSGGRGESLLKPDQDNAIIHAGSSEDDGWYARAGERISALLDAAGVPFCKGGVMAKNTAWRGAQGQWRARVTEWIGRHTPEALLNVDIFYDLQPVYGALRLGEALRFEALAAARTSPIFLRLLAEQTAQLQPALNFFGRLKSDPDGRIDLKLGGLLPLVSAARLMALKLGVPATGTADRLRAVGGSGLIGESDIAGLIRAHGLLLEIILRQQLADLAASRTPGSRVDPTSLTAAQRDRLKAALKHVALLPDMVQDVLTSPPPASGAS